MSEIELKFTFDTDATDIEATDWANSILAALPVGTAVQMSRVPLVVDVNDLGPEHEGYNIVINRGTDKPSISGKLNTVYPRGGREFGKMLVVDGAVFEAHAYEVATLRDN